MKDLECAICCHDQKELIERMLRKGEPIWYLQKFFTGLTETVVKSHREYHMDPADSIEFASPQNILWDMQELRRTCQGLMDFATKKNRPVLLLSAIDRLLPVLEKIQKQANLVHRVQTGMDGEILYQIVLRELADHPELLGRIKKGLNQHLLEHETE